MELGKTVCEGRKARKDQLLIWYRKSVSLYPKAKYGNKYFKDDSILRYLLKDAKVSVLSQSPA